MRRGKPSGALQSPPGKQDPLAAVATAGREPRIARFVCENQKSVRIFVSSSDRARRPRGPLGGEEKGDRNFFYLPPGLLDGFRRPANLRRRPVSHETAPPSAEARRP